MLLVVIKMQKLKLELLLVVSVSGLMNIFPLKKLTRQWLPSDDRPPLISLQEPELHKAMVLLLARCWDYKLKTEDVLELTQGNRRIALCTVVGLLEDGETYSTVLKQRQKPTEGQLAQWEHELIIQKFEKPLLLQVCRLLRGFTHPGLRSSRAFDSFHFH
jgi:hypothetical protein